MTRGRPVKRRKRSSGEGSIMERVIKGVSYWVVRLTLSDGSRTKEKYFRSHEEASEALLRMRIETASGVVPSDMTFTEWSEHYISTRRGLKPKTLNQYTYNLAVASSFFGKKKLAKLSPADIEAMNNALIDSGLSSTYVRQIHTNVGTCLKGAYKRGLIAKDICSLVDAPKALKRKPIILSRGQWAQLIESTRATARELIIEFALKTGMRINEALSTTWSQIDEAGLVTVGDSKTEAGSGRSIPLDSALMQRLKTLRAEHRTIQLQHSSWNSDDFVFCTSEGKRNNRQNLQRRVLTPLLKEAGLPHLTWHHLRHNAGSYLLSENVPITAVSKILGHANPAITMGIYAHELSEDLEQVRVAMAKFA